MSVEFALSLSLLCLWWPFDCIQTQLPKELWKSSTSKCWSSSVKSWTADLSAKLPPKKSALANWMTPKLKNSDTSLASKKKSISGEHGNIKGWMATMGGSKRPSLYNLYLRESLFIYDIMVLMSQWNDCAACRMPLFWKLNFTKSSSQEKVGKTELLRPSDQVYRFKTILGGKFRLWVRKISCLKFKEHSRHQPGYDQTSHYKWGRKVSPRKIT